VHHDETVDVRGNLYQVGLGESDVIETGGIGLRFPEGNGVFSATRRADPSVNLLSQMNIDGVGVVVLGLWLGGDGELAVCQRLFDRDFGEKTHLASQGCVGHPDPPASHDHLTGELNKNAISASILLDDLDAQQASDEVVGCLGIARKDYLARIGGGQVFLFRTAESEGALAIEGALGNFDFELGFWHDLPHLSDGATEKHI
jgi:hypothetical protein